MADVLPKIEDFEMKSRDLLRHRIRTKINDNRSRAKLISNYVSRMEDFDQGMCYIKDRESVPDIEQILETFERVESKRADLGNRMHGISVESDQLNAKNNALLRENEKTNAELTELEEFNDIHLTLHEQKDGRVAKKLKDIKEESVFLDDEFLDFKDIVYQSFLFWETTPVGKSVPLTKDMVQREFIQLGAFNPMKLMGWFTQMTMKIAALKVKSKVKTEGDQSRLDSGMTKYINIHGTKDTSEGMSTTMDQSGSRNLLSGTTKNYETSDGVPHRVVTDYTAGDYIDKGSPRNNRILEGLDEHPELCKTEASKPPKNLSSTLPHVPPGMPPIAIKKKDGHNLTMNDFELKYGDQGDYMNDYRMLDFNVVRAKNYRTMLKKAEVKTKQLKDLGTSRNNTERAKFLGVK